MIVGHWNIRGLGSSFKQKIIKSFIYENKYDVMCILESKLNSGSVPSIVDKIAPGWCFIHNFGQNRIGRILIIWNPVTVCVQMLYSTDQLMHCLVEFRGTAQPWFMSCVYAYNNPSLRRSLWIDLRNIAGNIKGPWTVLGDFNCIWKQHERINGAPVRLKDVKELTHITEFCDLTDLNFAGTFYTWNNKARDGPRLMSKIDRVLVNPTWSQVFDESRVLFQPPGISDHSPSVLFCHPFHKFKSPFKFLNAWCLHPDFTGLVSSSWLTPCSGSPTYRLACKLKRLKPALRSFHHLHFSGISDRVKLAKSQLLELQGKIEKDPHNPNLPQLEEPLLSQLQKLSKYENLFLAQRAKLKWIREGDANTNFFHAYVKNQKNRNKITAIANGSGQYVTSPTDISTLLVDFYQNHLGQSAPRSSIDPMIVHMGAVIEQEDCLSLTRIPSDFEIKEAFFSIDDSKAPGVDGFSAAFFKNAWSIVGRDVYKAVKHFFYEGHMPIQFNSTVLSLIPKIPNPQSPADFRPIACCNVIYKGISKILTSRLKAVINKLISLNQSAFIPGRKLSHNVLLAQDIMRFYGRRHVSPRCTIKVDLSKAYDCVNWEFLEDLLNALGFPLQFTRWIMECVTTVTYSLSINGEIKGFFPGKRGLRQGDPLSPYLFSLAMEYFNRMMCHMKSSPAYKFHPKCSKIGLTHLSYADDLLLFCRADHGALNEIKTVLTNFSEISGLSCNSNKSLIFMAGVPPDQRNMLLHLMCFNEGRLPFTYLGIPISSKSLTSIECNTLADKITGRINIWSSKLLTYAGRLELIRAVIYPTFGFWASILVLPKKVIRHIIKLMRSFLWKGVTSSHRAPVAWAEVCLPRRQGGLGLFHLKELNTALFMKHLWSLINDEESLWIQWIHTYHISASQSFWDMGSKNTLPRSLQMLLKCRGQALSCFDRINATWIGLGQPFSTKGTYLSLTTPTTHNQPPWWTNILWSKYGLSKCSFISWLVLRNKLTTKDRLAKWMPNIDPKCFLCQAANEDRNHLFFSCPVASRIWSTVCCFAGWNWPSDWNLMKQAELTSWGNGFLSNIKKAVWTTCVYHIWRLRNSLMAADMRTSENLTTRNIISDLKLSFTKISARPKSRQAISWCTRMGIMLE